MDTFFTGSKDLDNHVNRVKHRKAVQNSVYVKIDSEFCNSKIYSIGQQNMCISRREAPS